MKPIKIQVIDSSATMNITVSDAIWRDVFAAAALAGILANNELCTNPAKDAAAAYRNADAMMEARKAAP